MDCFVAEFIIGPAEGGTRWLLAMTARGISVTDKDLHYYEPASGHGLKHDPFNAIIAPDRLDLVPRCQGQHQSGAL